MKQAQLREGLSAGWSHVDVELASHGSHGGGRYPWVPRLQR